MPDRHLHAGVLVPGLLRRSVIESASFGKLPARSVATTFSGRLPNSSRDSRAAGQGRLSLNPHVMRKPDELRELVDIAPGGGPEDAFNRRPGSARPAYIQSPPQPPRRFAFQTAVESACAPFAWSSSRRARRDSASACRSPRRLRSDPKAAPPSVGRFRSGAGESAWRCLSRRARPPAREGGVRGAPRRPIPRRPPQRRGPAKAVSAHRIRTTYRMSGTGGSPILNHDRDLHMGVGRSGRSSARRRRSTGSRHFTAESSKAWSRS